MKNKIEQFRIRNSEFKSKILEALKKPALIMAFLASIAGPVKAEGDFGQRIQITGPEKIYIDLNKKIGGKLPSQTETVLSDGTKILIKLNDFPKNRTEAGINIIQSETSKEKNEADELVKSIKGNETVKDIQRNINEVKEKLAEEGFYVKSKKEILFSPNKEDLSRAELVYNPKEGDVSARIKNQDTEVEISGDSVNIAAKYDL
uniref:Uncharacterized protein n=1 Tax=candidate division CPR3 bacterium TaxID=2268181 RepID=A0A7C4M0C4_UNCC3